MRGRSRLVIDDFSLGLVTSDDAGGLPLGAAADLLNVEPMGSQGLKRRRPTALYSAATSSSISQWFDSSAQLGFALGIGTTNLYRVDTATSIGAHGMGTVAFGVAEGPASGGQGPIYMLNGSASRYSTGAAQGAWTASAGTIPLSTIGALVFHGNRMWSASTSGQPSRLFFSEALDPRNWPANNYVDIDPAAGGPILAICPCGPYLLVFKRDRVYSVYDLNTGANRMISSSIGSTLETVGWSNLSVTAGRYGTAYFASEGEVFVTDGNTISKVSQAIEPFLTPQTEDWAIYLSYVQGYLLVHDYVEEVVWIYDEARSSWWKHEFTGQLTAVVGAATVAATPVFLLTTGNNILTWRPEHNATAGAAGNDYGSAGVTSRWTSGDLDLGDPNLRKRVRTVAVTGTGVPYLTYGRDGATSLTDKALTFSTATVAEARAQCLGVGRLWRFGVRAASTAAWELNSLRVNFNTRRN